MRRHSPLPAAAAVFVSTAPLAAAHAQPAPGAPSPGAAAAPAARADTGAAVRGLVTGHIVDAATGEALPGALVVLVPRPEGVFPTAGAGPSAFPAAARRARTDAAGRYHFGTLAPGAYRIHATRLGYGAAAVDVTVADAAPEVSLGLVVAPLALRPVEVRAAMRRGTPDTRAGTPAADGAARLAAVALRQRAYLTTDARELTRADVGEAATLAESDLFRALHRLPGVSTRDEWAAELWTRGARPDLTRVTLDGLPLYSPVAAFGAFAAVNADAVGSATLLPGVRPAAVGEGGAAVLDLRTRAGGGAGGRASSGVAGVGEVGVASARLTLDGSTADGRAAWTVAGRRSYLDGIGWLLGEPRDELPRFGDLTARGDLRLSPTQLVAVSGLLQYTASGSGWLGLQGSSQGAAWGNRVLRLTHAAEVGVPGGGRRLRVTHTAGGSAHAFGGRGPFDEPVDWSSLDSTIAPNGPPAAPPPRGHPDVRVSAALFRGEITPVAAPDARGPAAGEPTWGAGYEVSRQRTRYVGDGRQFFTGSYNRGPALLPDLAARDSLALTGAVTIGAAWAVRRWQPTARLALEPGLRLELAGGGAGTPVVLRPAPRLAARYLLGPGTRLSAALGRSVQYTQSLSRIGLDDLGRFYPGALWLAAGRAGDGRNDAGGAAGLDVPALTTDLATLGAERWLGGGWLGSVNLYARRTRGLVTYDPAPGVLADTAARARPLFVTGREGARGVDLSARRLVGRTTATLGYSWSASTIDAAGWRYAAPQDRPHAFDATLSHRLGARWRVGAAFSAASGTPYARTVEGVLVTDSAWAAPWAGWIVPDATTFAGLVREAPGARRHSPFLGADLLVEWMRTVRAWHVGAFAQIHSPLAAYTSNAYVGDGICFAPHGAGPEAVLGPAARCVSMGNTRQDTFAVIPTVGLRVAF